MKKLKIALLWHFHQPYYKQDNEFFLPWVRLHGVKDYWDLPELFYEYPKIKQTVNIVPSLWVQIQQYVSGECRDRVQTLTLMDPQSMNEDTKNELLRLFFLSNPENMIKIYPRFKELLAMKESGIKFSNQDITDLQVWYNLCWIGNYSRKRPAVQSLINKERNYDENDKLLVLEIHREILSQVENQLKTLQRLNRIEVSVSPYHHPILPLLVDSKAVNESMPNALLPGNLFVFPEDAKAQIDNSIDYYKSIFGNNPIGMWPSEGSISDKVLEIISKTEIKWLATDEMVLSNTLNKDYKSIYKYFPIKYKNGEAETTLFFRDHSLSDAIGFVYSSWNPKDSASDFLNRLANIRNEIINILGEEELENAVVPIILDGENCWEYYNQNGEGFLRELFSQLSLSSIIETVLFKDVLSLKSEAVPAINHIQAGSWINANFNIWAGHKDHRIAWSILSETRKLLEDLNAQVPIEKYKQAMEYIYICEGSDWFWWYGDSHWAENKFDFDVLFRHNLSKVYDIIGWSVPEILLTPINNQTERNQNKTAKDLLAPDILSIDEKQWNNAGVYNTSSVMSSMHQIGELIETVYFGNSKTHIFIRLALKKEIENSDRIILSFENYSIKDIEIKNSSVSSALRNNNMAVSFIANNIIFSINDLNNYQNIGFVVASESGGNQIKYPTNGKIELKIINGAL
jgi:alpha-amylase/alpha-mannosidase (GH57 family)